MGKRRGILGVGDGFADGDAFHSGDRDDVAQRGLGDVDPLEAGEGKELGDFRFVQRAIQAGDADIFAGVHGAVEHARDGEAAQVVAVVEIGHQNLQRSRRIAFRFGDGFDDGFEQRLQVFSAALDVRRTRYRSWRWYIKPESRFALPWRRGR